MPRSRVGLVACCTKPTRKRGQCRDNYATPGVAVTRPARCVSAHSFDEELEIVGVVQRVARRTASQQQAVYRPVNEVLGVSRDQKMRHLMCQCSGPGILAKTRRPREGLVQIDRCGVVGADVREDTGLRMMGT